MGFSTRGARRRTRRYVEHLERREYRYLLRIAGRGRIPENDAGMRRLDGARRLRHNGLMMPSRIGRYRVEGCLGRGGMGEVWKAWDEGLDRWVAIKSLIPGMLSAERREGLKQEARAVAALSHPAIAQIYDIVSEDGADYLVLEFVEGTNLGKALHEGRLATATALRLAADVAGGLAAAHERGIVHRDLKPENVVMTPDGRAKILDFGLARLIAAGSPAAAEGGFGGTLSAMSPEQVERRPLDQRTDLFSLGSLMYEMLTGQHPFKAGFPIETMHRISHFQPPRVDEVDSSLPLELGRLTERLMAKSVEARPQRAGEVAHELHRILLAMEPSDPAASRSHRRRRWVAAAAGLVVAVAGLGLWWQTVRATEPLYVAVLRPHAEEPGDGELLASAVRLAEMNALAGLDGVYVLGGNEVDAISGPPARVAAAVGAGDLLAARVRRTGTLARVELTRYAADGRVVWTDAFDAPADDFQLLVETTAAHLVRGYASHRPRRGAFTDSASPEAYRDFLELRQEVQHPAKDLSWPAVLDRLTSLRERAPSLLNIHLLEASVARYLYESTLEPRYLERADAAVAAARKLAPEDPRPLITALEVDLAANRLDAAESKVDEIARLAPSNPEVLLQRATLAERRGDLERAIALLERSLSLRRSWRTLLVLGKEEILSSRFEDAKVHLEEALALAPGNVFVRAELANIEANHGDPARAEELYLGLVADSPQPVILVNLAHTEMLMGRYAQAAQRLEAVVASGVHLPVVDVNLGDCYLLLGKDVQARDMYRQVIQITEASGELTAVDLGFRAQALARLGRSEDAVATVERAAELAPNAANVAYHAALVYVLTGKTASALSEIRRAVGLGLDPRWFDSSWFDGIRPDIRFGASLGGTVAHGTPIPSHGSG